MVKTLPAMQEIRVQSLRLEDPLEKEMAIHSTDGKSTDGGTWRATVPGVTESQTRLSN